MTPFLAAHWPYAISGLAVGLLVGFTGVGGGSLMTPVLVLLFGVNPATAVGTDLLFAGVTKTCGTAVHGISKTVDWRVTGLLAAGSIPSTAATLAVLAALGLEGRTTGSLITSVLGLALILTSVAILARTWLVQRLGPGMKGMADRVPALTVLLGAVLGILVCLSSVGAGAIGMTALYLLYPHIRPARLVGSDIAHAVPLTLVAGMGHWYLGTVDWPLLLALLVGSLPGIAVGSHFAGRVPDKYLRITMAVVLALVGGKLLA